MAGSSIDRQLTTIRCRIRANVKAAISQEWDSLQKWYKPTKVVDATDARWLALIEQQESLREKIEAASDQSTSAVKKYMIITALRNEFPKIAARVPAPPEPQIKSQPTESTLPSYEAATAKMAMYTASSGLQGSQPTDLQPNGTSIKRKVAETPRSGPSTKKVKANEFYGKPSEDEDIAGHGDFDPKQERTERVVMCGERKQRTEDKAAGVNTVEQLERQREDLRDKYCLDDIQMLKKIAEIRGDKRASLKLVEEELNLKHKRAMEQARRKYSMED
ncbi:hypothetical protein CERZMDRAFT_94223 [Cercospora zeae-maydis SCOH1-5]|uniref:Uncharacterized protein n=1 Tax=Cercospora zeae-maydis SCOH1-5 TaxID=717836 RepID=A0A6A6FRC5_9PEZI|nr:hypothetical protein CERZMDRAFT_94223 [Cercospora zeae-maydis SCOH1-5]